MFEYVIGQLLIPRMVNEGVNFMSKKRSRAKAKHKKKSARGARAVRPVTSSAETTKTWYSVLGVGVQADQETIHARYLEMVQRFPPETHPDEFEMIRQAYEVLSDARQRHRYDRERFYGTTVAKLEDMFARKVQERRLDEALQVMKQLVDIDPVMTNLAGVAMLYRALGQTADADLWFRRAEEASETVEDQVDVLIEKAHLSEGDEAIIDALLTIAKEYPKVSKTKIATELLTHYAAVDQLDKGMAHFRKLISRKKYLTVEDFEVYVDWLEALSEIDQIEALRQVFLGQVKPAAERAAKGPHHQAIAQRLSARLEDIEVFDRAQFRLRTMIADLARTVEPNDPELTDVWRAYTVMSSLFSQFERLLSDERIPTSVMAQIVGPLFEELGAARMQIVKMLQERINSPMALSEAEAIALIRQFYPRVFSVFGEAWLSRSAASP